MVRKEDGALIPITTSQVTHKILSLFDLTKPTMPRAFNVLEGITRGSMMVDDLTNPTAAVVHETVYVSLYFGGKVDAILLESLVQQFRQTHEVGIGCWLDDPLNDMLPANPGYDGRTLYFTERRHTIDENRFSLPARYDIAVRDQTLLKQSFDYESTLASCGSEEKVLHQTLGVVILHEGQLACEAATSAPAQGWIEVGVTTAEEHRQRGLASIACARLIGMCEAQGYATWWDCAKQNLPSIKLARKLGFCNEREYRYVWWPKMQAAGLWYPSVT
jgi:RimJ/RimL family protein N-acetyltransferase